VTHPNRGPLGLAGVLLAGMALTGCFTARSQAPGAIVAVVHGPSSPLRDVDVLLQGPVPGGSVTRRTDSCGTVSFDRLPDGKYTLKAAQGGFDGAVQTVSVTRGKESMADLRLKPSDDAAAKGSGCTLGQHRYGPPPGYTPVALEHNVEGCLVIKCLVTSTGTVRSCSALEPLPDLTEPAIHRLERQMYEAPTCDGKPADIDYTFRISFRMARF